MIETRTALDNLDAIAATEGIDALFVGPSDLSIALGRRRRGRPAFRGGRARARPHRRGGATRRNKIPGLYCANAERAVFAAKRGFRFLAVGSDLGFLRAGAAAQAEGAEGVTRTEASDHLTPSS